MNIDQTNQQIIDANEEIYASNLVSVENVNVYSRDWTVGTMYQQIKENNIDLSPKFQRRNAWTDEKRSRLIESLELNLPIPEVVLAENPYEKGKLIVIDGRQRLMTIFSYLDQDKNNNYWENPTIQKLTIRNDLNGKTYTQLDEEQKRKLDNASIRCTVIFGLKDDSLLYEIFHRINSGAVPLSTQELRQALFKGKFSDFLLDKTNEAPQPIHKVLGITKPHDRLLDAELLLKFFAFFHFPSDYKGNLKQFLDNCSRKLNLPTNNIDLDESYDKFNQAITQLKNELGGDEYIGRLLNTNNNTTTWNNFNANLFIVQVCYFAQSLPTKLGNFKSSFQELCKDDNFISTFKSQTSSLDNVKKRFSFFEKMMNKAFNTNFDNQFFSNNDVL